MGGVVSAGVDNDDLIDKLKTAEYIKTKEIEKIFRLVDRGCYLTKDCQNLAYRDNAWRSGNLHISAPCIYAQVMEGLQIGSGMSFLNIGSGTGYLSTMAGLLIGPNGINHGIELHSDVVEYARDRLNWFLSNSGSIDVTFFCEPQFSQGNGLSLRETRLLYDRVYCGASCPSSHEEYMKNLIKINGVLVMPHNDQLLKIVRTGTNSWTTESLLPVSFSSLVMPEITLTPDAVDLPPVNIISLQEIAREAVRSYFRSSIETENEDLKSAFTYTVPTNEAPMERKPFCRIGRAFPDGSAYMGGSGYESDPELREDSWASLHQSQELHVSMHSAFIELARSFISRTANSAREAGEGERDEELREEEEDDDDDDEEPDEIEAIPSNNDNSDGDRMAVDNEDEDFEEDDDDQEPYELLKITNEPRTIRIVTCRGFSNHILDEDEGMEQESNRDENVNNRVEQKADSSEKELAGPSGKESVVIGGPSPNCDDSTEMKEVPLDNGNASERKTSNELFKIYKSDSETRGDDDEFFDTNEGVEGQEAKGSCSKKVGEVESKSSQEGGGGETSSKKGKKKREKFDSGIVEDIDPTMSIGSSSSCSFKSRSDSSESSICTDEESPSHNNGGRNTRSKLLDANKRRKRKTMRYPMENKTDSVVPIQKYSLLMRQKIKELPLPFPLKVYVNYNRPL